MLQHCEKDRLDVRQRVPPVVAGRDHGGRPEVRGRDQMEDHAGNNWNNAVGWTMIDENETKYQGMRLVRHG